VQTNKLVTNGNTTVGSVEITDAEAENPSIGRLPKLFWGGAILFSVNLVIATCIAISPELNVTVYGDDIQPVNTGKKPTAFVNPEPRKPGAVRAAVKLTPVVEPIPETQAYVSSEKAYEAAEREGNFVRVTASAMPLNQPSWKRTPTSAP
jgi:hypothetical protein